VKQDPDAGKMGAQFAEGNLQKELHTEPGAGRKNGVQSYKTIRQGDPPAGYIHHNWKGKDGVRESTTQMENSFITPHCRHIKPRMKKGRCRGTDKFSA